jgi:hypothetical protein
MIPLADTNGPGGRIKSEPFALVRRTRVAKFALIYIKRPQAMRQLHEAAFVHVSSRTPSGFTSAMTGAIMGGVPFGETRTKNARGQSDRSARV